MNASFKNSLGLAAAAAALFATAAIPTTAAAADGMVKCSGVNTCKGTSECKTASSGCKGQNGCKGQGWVQQEVGRRVHQGGRKSREVTPCRLTPAPQGAHQAAWQSACAPVQAHIAQRCDAAAKASSAGAAG